MKASRSSQPKSPGKVHSVRITLSSRDVKNLEKVCADLVNGSQNKKLKVNGDEVAPVKFVPVSTEDSPSIGGFPIKEGRPSKKGCTNFRWSPAMSHFLLPFLVQQVRLGRKVNKSFKRHALLAAAKAVSDKFNLICTDSNVENHLRTIKTRYLQIKKIRSLGNSTWVEDEKKIVMDAVSYNQHIAAHPKDEPFINKAIEMYDEMAIICGDEPVAPRIVVGADPVFPGDDVNVIMDENIETEEEAEETHSRSQQISTSSDSTGRTRQCDQSNNHLAEKIDLLAFQIGRLADAIRTSQRGIASELFQEVMKSDGYNEASLGKAFDYLNEHEHLARGFLAKNYHLRQAWLAEFFSAGYLT
ncbi:Ribosomal protein S10 protein [Dioscorea alata]|uniref:Ribosomal protein S10 protein n=3 Tax=Dioscorea alata TaxID=55571 RepID=A0ACB7WGP6_DIOAL|nr:Ribosomal protein S10 protein [Dioscorea alata]KAH7687033.1 Ribosomal protein S10 protein [Dioscorea alata]KAH7687034.1 Ribosomal protein S10 protein [Dioscorea alata]